MQKEKLYEITVGYITENQEKFYRFAFGYTKEREAALDVVQNAICKALGSFWQIRNEEKIAPWFYRVLLNEIYSYLKKQKREVAVGDEKIPLQIYTETAFDKDYGIYDLVMTLPEKFKTVIVLRYFEDMSLEEISKVTAVNLSTVKSRLYTALKRLKEEYGKVEGNE